MLYDLLICKAYLRLRPPHGDKAVSPYIQVVNETEIIMTPPQDSGAFKTRSRQPERYKFTKVFDTNTPQKDFFDESTLPLVKDVLNGENALLFAYGVTNSGKTYSIQGTPQEPGILPRCLDVIFNSLNGLHSDSRVGFESKIVTLLTCSFDRYVWTRWNWALKTSSSEIPSPHSKNTASIPYQLCHPASCDKA